MFPPHRVLATVDFSDGSRVALNAAGRLATQCGAELLVVHAIDPLLSEAARTAGVDLTAETNAELAHFVDTAVTAPNVRRLVVKGTPADAICAIAERERADVIVIGAHGISGVADVLFGSTTERVLRRSAVSVCVVPSTWSAPDPAGPDFAGVGPVVVGVDLRCGSAAAAGAASQLAHVLHTRLEIIHVVPPMPVPGRWHTHAERAIAAAVRRAREDLAVLCRGLRSDVRTTVRVEIGNVAQCLADAARPHGECRPLLVLGRNAAHAHRSAPGAIAHRVLMQATAPVLIYLPTD